MENHYSKFICNLFIKRSNIEEKKIVLAILLKNKQNNDIFNTNKSSHDFANKFDINNKNPDFKRVENNQINDNINTPLSNDAKPFFPKKRNNKFKR